MSEWQFLLDENVDPKVATYLEKEELSAVHVRIHSDREQTTKTMFSRIS